MNLLDHFDEPEYVQTIEKYTKEYARIEDNWRKTAIFGERNCLKNNHRKYYNPRDKEQKKEQELTCYPHFVRQEISSHK
jgi:hypothetical protein